MSPGLRDLLFVCCLTTVLTVGVLGVLLLNTAMQQQSDRMAAQRQRVQTLTEQAQQLRTTLDRLADPATLAEKARRLHMQPVQRLRFAVTGSGVLRGTAVPSPDVSRRTREAARNHAD